MEAPPSYIDFTGEDGLELEISLPSTGPFDYTVMFWFRSVKSYKQLSVDDSIKDGQRAYLFEIPGFDGKKFKSAFADKDDSGNGVGCYISNPGTGPKLNCGVDEEIRDYMTIDLKELPDI